MMGKVMGGVMSEKQNAVLLNRDLRRV